MSSPKITVLLPVYNGEEFVEQAILSILAQTFTDFELLVINDGSTDKTVEILAQCNDPRIRLIHQENMGLATTLNYGISLAQGRYIARQDHDDLSLPTRLEKQWEYMENNPDCALLGTCAEIWVSDIKQDRRHDHPTEYGPILFALLFDNPFVHSSIMMRHHNIKCVGGYSSDPLCCPPEDYELWSRLARRFKVANLSERLVIYREVAQSISRSQHSRILENVITIAAENLAHIIGLSQPNDLCFDVAAIHHSAFHRLSGQPNIKQICETVILAGKKIAQDNNAPYVVHLAEKRAAMLRYKFLMFRSHTLWAKPLLSNIRSWVDKSRAH
ncbi:glycosyltransferase family 2 protein [Methylobacter psychrophilus]|uniref:glycosyltransferase family 2 protein n=1 Tax=Methylobacter psychrophilus TaxID=96941 RepID=UPI0021D51C4C|nr:glycosyltransferase family 2 protein [Methylobacter psychrophilus]